MTKVLIVEDESIMRLNLEAFLEDYGFDLISVETGEEGVEKIKGNDFDVVIVDLRLPGIDGNTVIREGLKLKPNLKIIIHTGSIGYTLPEDLIKLGLNESQVYFKANTKLEDLANKINEMLSNE